MYRGRKYNYLTTRHFHTTYYTPRCMVKVSRNIYNSHDPEKAMDIKSEHILAHECHGESKLSFSNKGTKVVLDHSLISPLT